MRTTRLHHTTSLHHESYPPPPSRATLTLDESEDSKISLEGLGAIDLTDAGLATAKIAADKHATATARPTLSKEELRTKVVAVAMAPMASASGNPPATAGATSNAAGAAFDAACASDAAFGSGAASPSGAASAASAASFAASTDAPSSAVAPFDVALFDEDVNDVDVNDIDIDLIVRSLADALGDGEIDTTPLDYDTRGLDPLTVQCPSRHHTPPTHLR